MFIQNKLINYINRILYLRLLCLILMPFFGLAQQINLNWNFANQLKNGSIYFIASSGSKKRSQIPSGEYYDINQNNQFYILDSEPNIGPLSVFGTNGASSFTLRNLNVFNGRSLRLYVSTAKCILKVSGNGEFVDVIAGSCIEGGARNGPPLYSRFDSIDVISAQSNDSEEGNSEENLFLAVLDSGLTNKKGRVSFINNWSVNDIGLFPDALDISLVCIGGKTKGIAFLLVLTPTYALLIVGNMYGLISPLHMTISKNSFNISSKQKILYEDEDNYFVDELIIFSDQMFPRLEIKNSTYDNNNNSNENSNSTNFNEDNAQPSLISCVLLLKEIFKGDVKLTAYILLNQSSICKMEINIDINSNNEIYNIMIKSIKISCLKMTNDVVYNNFIKRDKLLSGGINNTIFTVDLENQIFQYIPPSKFDNQICKCDIGLTMIPINTVNHINYICIPSPPGGYTLISDSARFIPCPIGTYNSNAMSISPLACKKCPDGFIAPMEGSVLCTSCNSTHPWKSPIGTSCLSEFPSWISQKNGPCPNPGTQIQTIKGNISYDNSVMTTTTTTEICEYCPAMQSALYGEPCKQCEAGKISNIGSEYCSKICYSKSCSPYGLDTCYNNNDQEQSLYTIAAVESVTDKQKTFRLVDIPQRKTLSIAKFSNGSIILGDNMGTLTVIVSSSGEFTISIQIPQLNSLNILEVSGDESLLFVADTLTGSIVQISMIMSSDVIITSKIQKPRHSIRPISLLFYDMKLSHNENNNILLIVDELSNSILSLNLKSNIVSNIFNATAFAFYGRDNNSNNITNIIISKIVYIVEWSDGIIFHMKNQIKKNMDYNDTSNKRIISFWYINSANLFYKVVRYEELNILSYFENIRSANNINEKILGNNYYHISNWFIRRTIITDSNNKNDMIKDKVNYSIFGLDHTMAMIRDFDISITRNLTVDDFFKLFTSHSNNNSYNVNNRMIIDNYMTVIGQKEKLIRNGSIGDYLENNSIVINNNIIVDATPSSSKIIDTPDILILFIEDSDSTYVKALFSRSCECASGFYMIYDKRTDGGACVKCPTLTHSMVGSVGCSTCPSGQFLDNLGNCARCPERIWWDSEMYHPCRKMQSSLITTLNVFNSFNYNDTTNRGNLLIDSYGKNGIFSLLEAQMIANVQKSGDIICMATFLSSNIHPSIDILIQGDFLGKLWSIQTIIITPLPQLVIKKGSNVYVKNETDNTDNKIVLDWPGLWVLCDSPVQVYEPCVCKYNSFQLGYPASDTSNNNNQNNGWEMARQKLSYMTVEGNNVSANASDSIFTTNSIYVIRLDDQYTTAPILIRNGNDGIGFVKLYPNNPPVGDMGLCFVGWPAKFNCTSPYFYWVFPSIIYPGGACVQCPDGTIAPTPSSLECLPIDTIKNPLCLIGTYKKQIINDNNGEISYQCETCPQNTYNSENYGVSQCKPKLVLSCPQGYYIKNMGFISDNICIQCVVCSEDSVMIPYLDIPCTGETFYQPYVCMKWLQSIPGYYVSISMSDQMPFMKYFPCQFLPPYAVWSDGPPLQDVCYFKCKYGVNQDIIPEYALNFTLLSSNNKWPTKTTSLGDNSNIIDNLFPYMPDKNLITSSICTPCNKSECPQNMWRPLWADGCGPPCYISPELCYGRTDGCVARCNIPENSEVVGSVSSSGSSTACTWICLFGWFNDGGDNCLKCGAANCKIDEYYVGDRDCLPQMKKSEICKKCPLNVIGGILSQQVGKSDNITNNNNDSQVIIRRCIYDCLEHEGYYLNPNPYQRDATPCVKCPGSLLLSNIDNVAITCPIGYKVNCGNNPCQECQNPNILGGRAYLVQTNDDVCRVKCKPGYITTNAMYSNVLPFNNGSGGYDPRYIICEECLNRRDIDCVQLPNCGSGTAPMSQGDNSLICAPCKTPSTIDCEPGTYYPFSRCDKSIEIYDTCLSCPYYDFITKASINDIIVPGQWPSRFFISYNDAKIRGSAVIFLNTVITTNSQPEIGCATACVSDSIISPQQGICISCSVLYPTIPKNAPYGRYYSLWNASEGLRWWPEEYDPPHMGKRPMDKLGNLLPEKRAGICWPCPSHSPTHSPQSGENDPCSLKKEVQVDTISFNLNDNSNNVNGTISNSNNKLFPVQIKYTSITPTTFVWIVNYNSDGNGIENNANGRRRLLSSSLLSTITDINGIISGDKKQLMTVQDTSQFISCKPGQYLVLPEGRWCALCPKNFYCTGNKDQPIQCAMYSITIRQGSTSSVDCTCKRGYLSHFKNLPLINIYSYNNNSLSLLSSKVKNKVTEKGDFVCKLIDENSYTSCSPGYFRTPINYLKRTLPSLVPQCMPCPEGTFGFNDQCHICPASSYANQVGSTSCNCISNVPENQKTKLISDIKGDITTITEKKCMSQERCSVRDILDVADSMCKPCQLNQAMSIPNTYPPVCMCEPGMMLITISKNSSSNFVEGRNTNNNNILLSSPSSQHNYYFQYCKPCPKGTYSQYAGNSPCTPCPPLTTTSSYGSKNLFDCIKINSLFV